MQIKSFAPAVDWHFRHLNGDGKTFNTLPLAGWAVVSSDSGEDSVIGMVSVSNGGAGHNLKMSTPHLVPVPPLEGVYLRTEDLNK